MRSGLSLILVLFCMSACASSGQSAARSAIHGFQRLISPVDGDRCMMLPSCSAYAEDAIVTHGLFWGWIMTCDRLMRCGRDELTQSDIVMIDGQSYCVDPRENNDFWWDRERP
jgi:putative component of membrane protein insertase Oxa1/YidC/SpoIIIJ protein YidD